MNLQFGKMSRRKQSKPNRLNEDEENEPALFNGKLLQIFPKNCHFYWLSENRLFVELHRPHK